MDSSLSDRRTALLLDADTAAESLFACALTLACPSRLRASASVRGVGEHEWGPSSVRRCAIACELGWKVGHYGRRVMIYKKLYDFKRSSVLAARAKAGERAYLF